MTRRLINQIANLAMDIPKPLAAEAVAQVTAAMTLELRPFEKIQIMAKAMLELYDQELAFCESFRDICKNGTVRKSIEVFEDTFKVFDTYHRAYDAPNRYESFRQILLDERRANHPGLGDCKHDQTTLNSPFGADIRLFDSEQKFQEKIDQDDKGDRGEDSFKG